MNRQTYPVYKPSDIAWLGEIPEHWEVQKLKYIALVQVSNVDKKSSDEEEPVYLCNYVDVYNNDFITKDLSFMRATATKAEIDKFIVRQGDIIITKDSESWDDIAVPAYVSDELQDVLCGYHLALISSKSRSIHGKYLFRAFSSKSTNYQFQIAATGVTRYGLGNHWLKNGLFLVPSPDEQHAIASFLDRETAQIDILIENKERQIELLREKRAATISHAVTNGLDSRTKMKHSGNEWVGVIPEHWETKRLKYLASVNDEVLPVNTDPDFGLLYVDISSVDANKGIAIKEAMTFDNAPSRARRKVSHGDVIVSTVRTYLRAIAPVVNPEPNLIVSTGFAVVRPNAELNSQFAAYALRAPYFVEAVVANSVGVGYPAINASEMMCLTIAVPSPLEQQAIAVFLDWETARVDSLIANINKSIDLVREYRTALISTAVTGQIDVREEFP